MEGLWNRVSLKRANSSGSSAEPYYFLLIRPQNCLGLYFNMSGKVPWNVDLPSEHALRYDAQAAWDSGADLPRRRLVVM